MTNSPGENEVDTPKGETGRDEGKLKELLWLLTEIEAGCKN